MPTESILCPRCATESPHGASYCRKCGTSLQASVPLEEHRVSPVDERMRALRRDIIWEAVRGGVTLVLAIPFFIFMTIVAVNAGGAVTIGTLVILAAFIAFGIRDLKRAYSMLRNPAAALAASTTHQQLKPTNRFVEPTAIASDSVTDHTTFPLEKEAAAPDASPAGSKH